MLPAPGIWVLSGSGWLRYSESHDERFPRRLCRRGGPVGGRGIISRQDPTTNLVALCHHETPWTCSVFRVFRGSAAGVFEPRNTRNTRKVIRRVLSRSVASISLATPRRQAKGMKKGDDSFRPKADSARHAQTISNGPSFLVSWRPNEIKATHQGMLQQANFSCVSCISWFNILEI